MRLLSHMGVRHPYWDVNAKLGGYRFARAHGVETPTELGRSDSFAEIDWASISERVLIKPRSGANNRGVFALERLGRDRWREYLSGRVVTLAEVGAEYESYVEGGRISRSLILEELLRKPGSERALPDDIKVYCFYDRAELVMQRDMRSTNDRRLWRFKFWDRDWSDLGPIKFADRVDPGLAAPVHGEEIIAAAEQLGRALRLPFVRLDFYDTDRGAVFGEVTLTPGPPEVFAPDFDVALGRHFEAAAARVLSDDIAAGRLDHLTHLANPADAELGVTPPD